MTDFTINTRYIVTMPVGEISAEGVRLILDHIYSQLLQGETWKASNPTCEIHALPDLPDDWQWAWVINEGRYKGTLPKRIRNYYFKAHGIKCPDSFIEQLGNLARQHSESQTIYQFQIVDEFDWQAGDFGDYGSCYWDGNAGARLMLKENGGLAICFFTQSGMGYARAWLVEIGERLYIIFNGYGIERGVNATLTIARIFAQFLNVTYKKIGLDNYRGNSLYINGGIGYIIGMPESLADISEWDFGWDEMYADTCYSCGVMLDEYEVNYGADDQIYCEGCFYELFDHCEHCHEVYHRDNVDYIESSGQYLCRYCRAQTHDICTNCDEWYPKSDLHEHADALYCWDCLNDEIPPPICAE